MTIDMFLTTIVASGITTLLSVLYLYSLKLTTENTHDQNVVTVQIEPYVVGIYDDQCISTFYEALSWIISRQVKKLSKGNFLVQQTNSILGVDQDDVCTPPDFNILPEKNQPVIIEY